MTTVGEVYDLLNQKAPFSSQMSFDNSGMLVGDSGQKVKKIMLALDVTEEVVAEAAEKNCQLIVSHHPVIFHSLKRLSTEDPTGRILIDLIKNNISVISCHTNLDLATEGVNDCLATAVGLENPKLMSVEGTYEDGTVFGLCRVGELEGGAVTMAAFLERVKYALQSNGIRYVDAGLPVRMVAVGGGACSEYMDEAIRCGCDTFLTSDLKYHEFLDAKSKCINLVDAGHYPTENLVLSRLQEWLEEGSQGLEIVVSDVHHEVICYYS